MIVDESTLANVDIPEAQAIAEYLLLQKRVAMVESWIENTTDDHRIHGKVITNPECRHDADILAGLDAIFAANGNAYVVCSCESLDSKGRHFMWYQHSQRRNCCYHFCTALTRENWHRVGGFDERYADGIAYDDNDFRESVRAAGLQFVVRDDLKTTHLWHPKPHLELPNKAQLEARNKAIYTAKWGLTE